MEKQLGQRRDPGSRARLSRVSFSRESVTARVTCVPSVRGLISLSRGYMLKIEQNALAH